MQIKSKQYESTNSVSEVEYNKIQTDWAYIAYAMWSNEFVLGMLIPETGLPELLHIWVTSKHFLL